MVETPVPFDWTTDVDKTVGVVSIAPIMLVNHCCTKHIITLVPMSHAPCDFSALCSSMGNPWASLRHCHHHSHPCIVTGWNGFHQVYREKLLKYYINCPSSFLLQKKIQKYIQ
jgi:hypothetical protein